MPVDSLLAVSGTAETGTGWRRYLTNVNRAWRCAFDTATGTFSWKNASGTLITAVDNTNDQTIAGAKTFSGAVTMTGLGQIQRAVVTLTNAQFLALRATPVTLVAAPAAGFANQFLSAAISIDYTAAYTETTDNLLVRYTDGSGAAASAAIETTGWVDLTADSMVAVIPSTTGPQLMTTAAALVLHNTGDGELGGGNAANVIHVDIAYRVVAFP